MGKSSQQPTITTYYAGIHFVLCHGPVDKITKIFVDEKLAWEGDSTGGDITIDAPELFGGNIREGGIQGTVSLDFGDPSQTPNAYLESKLGEIPAYRRIVSAILNRVYLGTNYYLKPWAFDITRIHTRGTGTTQWYDAKAELSSSYYLDFSTITYEVTPSLVAVIKTYKGHGVTTGSTVTVSGADQAVYNQTFTPTETTETEIRYSLSSNPGTNATGDIKIGVTVDSLINAVHVIRDCFTDTTWGYGYAESLFPESTWQAAADTCYTEGLGFSFYWDGTKTLDKFIDDVCEHIQAAVYKSRVDGNYYITLLRPITDPGVLLDLSDHIVEVSNFAKQSLYDLTSIYSVSYSDNITGKTNETTVQDYSLYQRQGKPVKKSKTYNGIADLATAHKIATRDLLEMTVPKFSFTLKTDRTAENLNKGDAFKILVPEFTDEVLIMRVMTIDLGTPAKGEITIDCVQDTFHAATHEFSYFKQSKWENPLNQPSVAADRLAIEAPYYALARYKGDQFAQGIAIDESYILCAAKETSPDAYSAGIWTTTGTDFTKTGTFDFCYVALLDSTMDKLSTTLTVDSVEDINLLSLNHMIQIGDELMEVTDITSDVLTVKRGICDTIPEAHAIGDKIFAWQDFYGSDQIAYIVGETVKLKMTPITPLGELNVTSAIQDNIVLTGRLHKPYPPANVQIESEYWPTAIIPAVPGTISVTWATRNRYTQTTTVFIGFYEGDVTSESSVTYSGTLKKVSDSSVLDSFTGISATNYDFTTAYLGDVLLTLWSENADYDSQQTVTHTFTISS